MKVVEVEVGARGIEHFVEMLARGGALSRVVRASVLSSASWGRCFAVLPEEPRGADIYAFRTGGQFARDYLAEKPRARCEPVITSDRYVAARIAHLGGVRTVAYEAVNQSRSDLPRLAEHRVALLGESVVLLAQGENVEAEYLFRCMRRATSGWYELAVASTAHEDRWAIPVQQWDERDARELVDNARCITLGVYDGESCMIWWRGEPEGISV